MSTYQDAEKDFHDAYDASYTHWSTLWQESEKDLKILVGDHWDATLKSYLKAQGREALVFNKSKRVIKAISGYQRQHRLSLRAIPVENADEQTASILSSALMWNMQYSNGFHCLSDAFEMGTLVTGINLVEVAIDYTDDPVNGDLKLYRKPYNRFLLDPNLQQKDLSDCSYLLTRDHLAEEKLKQCLPKSVSIKDLTPDGHDTKFSYHDIYKDRSGKYPYKYDQMYVQTTTKKTILVDRASQSMTVWEGSEKRLKEYLELLSFSSGGNIHDKVSIIQRYDKDVELRILVEGHCVWKGPDPLGIHEYPFVPIWGFFVPEAKKAVDRIQGVIRCMRDPQDEVNKRRSKMLDILDSVIATGYKTFESAVTNKEQLYQSGQGKVIYVSDEFKGTPIDNAVKEILPNSPPGGLFQAIELMDKDLIEIPGFNNEMLGMGEGPDVEVAALLAKLRQQAGLAGLEDLFDNYRMSKKILGGKLIKAIQSNYSPRKIQMITTRQPTEQFYTGKFGKYGIAVAEGVYTDTQREHLYAQLLAMKTRGAPIPWASIIEAWPLEGKEKLLEAVQKAEQAESENNKQNQLLNKTQIELSQSLQKANLARAAEDIAQGQQHRASADLDRAKAAKELQEIDVKALERLIKSIVALRGLDTQAATMN